MSHEPPVPPASQSPFPKAEPPHLPSPPIARSIAEPKGARGLVLGGALAALGFAAIGGLAYAMTRRRLATPPKKRRGGRRKTAG